MMLLQILLAASLALADDSLTKYSLSASDNSINATFIAYGARLTSLLINDKNGKPTDVIVGFDDPSDYIKNDRAAGYHNYLGPIVGRYANRIKNGTFTINGVTSHVVENEHGGLNTLHGGQVGYDQRNWTVEAHNSTSITFSLRDQGFEGFPGSVITYATYTLESNRWTSRLVSIPLDEPTPIMLANHIYWNLDGFANKNILNNSLHMPYSDRLIAADGILVPTGQIEAVAGGPFDFTTPKQLGRDIQNSTQCGTGCVGIDNAFIFDRPRHAAEDTDVTVLQLSSPTTGITLDIKTDQQSMQIYACNGMDGTIPVKESQQQSGANGTFVEQYGCIVFETQQWIDGINHPEWGQARYQVFSPGSQPYSSYSTFDFSIAK